MINHFGDQKLCVYTVLLGEYEKLNEQIVAKDSQVDFICFSDNKNLTSRSWKIAYIEPLFPFDLARSSRIPKIVPHRFLKDYDVSLYIDNSILLKKTPERIYDELMEGTDIDMVCVKHSFRETLLDEFLAVALLQYDNLNIILEQLNVYYLIDPDALNERPYKGGFLMRNHHNQDVMDAMEKWLAYVLRYSRRDQLSLSYVLRSGKVKIRALDIDVLNSEYFQWPVSSGRDQEMYKQNAYMSNALFWGKLAQKEQRIKELEELADELERIKAGPVWKFTEPLRRFRAWLRLRNKVQG